MRMGYLLSFLFLFSGLVQATSAETADELQLYPAKNILSVAPTHTQAYGNEMLIWRNDGQATAIERYLANDAGAFHLQYQTLHGKTYLDSMKLKINWALQFRGYTLFGFQNYNDPDPGEWTLFQKIRLINAEGKAIDISDNGLFDPKLIKNSMSWFVGKDNKLYSFSRAPKTKYSTSEFTDTLSRWDITADGQLTLEKSQLLEGIPIPDTQGWLANQDVQGSAYITKDKIWLVKTSCDINRINRIDCLTSPYSYYSLAEIDLKNLKHLSTKTMKTIYDKSRVIVTTEYGVILHSATTSNIQLAALNDVENVKLLRNDAKAVVGYQQGQLFYVNLNNELCHIGMATSSNPQCETVSEDIGTLIKVEQKQGGQFWFTSNGIYWKQKQQAATLLQHRLSPDDPLFNQTIDKSKAGFVVAGDKLLIPGLGKVIEADGQLTPLKAVNTDNKPCDGRLYSSKLAQYGTESAVIHYYEDCLAVDALTVSAVPQKTLNQFVSKIPRPWDNSTLVAPGKEILASQQPVQHGPWQLVRTNLTTGQTDIISFEGAPQIKWDIGIYLVDSHWILFADGNLYKVGVGDNGTLAKRIGSVRTDNSNAYSTPDLITGNDSYLYLFYVDTYLSNLKMVVYQLRNETLDKVREVALPDVVQTTSYDDKYDRAKIYGNQLILAKPSKLSTFDISQPDKPVFTGAFDIALNETPIYAEIVADNYLIQNGFTGEIMKWSRQQPALEIPAELKLPVNLAEQKIFPLKAAQAKALQLVQAPKGGILAIRDDGLYFTAAQGFEGADMILAYTNPAGETLQLTTRLVVQPDAVVGPVQPDPVQPDPVKPEPAKTGSSGGASWWMLLLSALALCQRMPAALRR